MIGHFNLNLDTDKFSYVTPHGYPFVGSVVLTEKQLLAIREHMVKSATTAIRAGSNIMDRIEIQEGNVQDLPEIIKHLRGFATDLEELIKIYNDHPDNKKANKSIQEASDDSSSN